MSTFLVTTHRGVAKLHRSSCKKANANTSAVPTDDYQAGAPATCCKPRPVEPVASRSVPPAEAAKVATPKVDPTPSHEPVVPVLLDDPRAREAAAMDEARALRNAKRKGLPLPATPNLDAVNEAYQRGEDAAARRATGATRGRPKTEVLVRFFRNAKPMPDTQNKLSSVAYYHTAKIQGDAPRISTSDLREMLEDLTGTRLLESEPWGPVTLPNGVVLHAEAL